MTDDQGEEISANEYMLLIGDQQAARRKMGELRTALSESSNEFTYGNYYQFFPDMVEQKDGDWQGETQVPRAAGFGEGQMTERPMTVRRLIAQRSNRRSAE